MLVRSINGGGGVDINPLVILVRGGVPSGSTLSYLQYCIDNATALKYKYIKLMTVQEYTDFSGDSSMAAKINKTSAELYPDSTASSYSTISTTAVEISTLNLDSTKLMLITARSMTTAGAFAVKLYN